MGQCDPAARERIGHDSASRDQLPISRMTGQVDSNTHLYDVATITRSQLQTHRSRACTSAYRDAIP